ncbi:fec operon regulator FecR [compost metagenome]
MMPITASNALQPKHAVNPRAARQAAQWLVLMHSGEMTDAERLACDHWRASHADHELAWQRAALVSKKFGLVPSKLGAPVLRNAASMNRRAAIKTLALLVAAGPVAWTAYRVAPWQEWTANEHTATGEQRELTLPDGTRLTMNTATAIDIAFDDNTRRILLRSGEIMVNTAKDNATVARPFIVESKQGQMRALGTRFIVTQNHDSSRVAVTEGAIEVTPRHQASGAFIVGAGEQASFNSETGVLQTIDPHADAWTTGVLYAEKMVLAEFVNEISRYRPGILRCDPAIAELQVSGAFQLRDTDAVIKALVASLPIRASMVTRYWVTLGPI